MYEHKIELDFDLTNESLKKLTEELMEETKGKVAHKVLFRPLWQFALEVWFLANSVKGAVEAEDGDSPLAIAVRDITKSIDIVEEAVEAAKEVSESQSRLRNIGREMHALQSLGFLAGQLHSLTQWVSWRTPYGNSLHREDTRSEAVGEIESVLEELTDAIATAKTAFAAYETEGDYK